MALSVTENNHPALGRTNNASAGLQGQAPGAAASQGGDRRTAGFAELVRAPEPRVSGVTGNDANLREAWIGQRPDISSEVATKISDEARAEAEAALAQAIQSGQTLRAAIETAVQDELVGGGQNSANSGTGAATGVTQDRLARLQAEQTNWRTPTG